MDSLSHILIGAAIGEVILGKKIGRKSMFFGALAKTFPDFDLLYTGLSDPWMYMCHHRGHTHSLIWEGLYALPLAGLCYWIFRAQSVSYLRWLTLFLICLWGHSLLDACTNYGTRLLLPISETPIAWNSISIIDLLFTLPMLILLIISIFCKNGGLWRRRTSYSVIGYCLVYLMMTFVNKSLANTAFEKSLREHKISYSRMMTNPVILNNVYWYAVAVNDSQLYMAEKTLMNNKKEIIWTPYDRNMNLADSHPDRFKMNRLAWFSKGYDLCEMSGDTLNYYAAKFGRMNPKKTMPKETFVFHYQVFKKLDGYGFAAIEPEYSNEEFKKSLAELWQAILGN